MLIPMSDRDINRFKVLQDVRERRLRQIDAADILNISPRQVRRLLSQLSQYGASSLAHGSQQRRSRLLLFSLLKQPINLVSSNLAI